MTDQQFLLTSEGSFPNRQHSPCSHKIICRTFLQDQELPWAVLLQCFFCLKPNEDEKLADLRRLTFTFCLNAYVRGLGRCRWDLEWFVIFLWQTFWQLWASKPPHGSHVSLQPSQKAQCASAIYLNCYLSSSPFACILYKRKGNGQRSRISHQVNTRVIYLKKPRLKSKNDKPVL